MNVKLIYPNRIESWDTRADGSATTSHAQLVIANGTSLQLWSCLWRDEFDSDGNPVEGAQEIEESGYPREIARIYNAYAMDLIAFCDELHGQDGLLRLDVDGETLYEYMPGEEIED